MMTKNNKPEKKSILIICQHFWPETFRVTDIAEGLVEKGYHVDVLCGTPNYPAGKFFDGYGFFKNKREVHKGVNILRVPEIPRGNNSNFRILVNYVSFPFFAMFYVPYLLTKKYDRILVYQLSPVFMALPGIIISKIKGIKLYIYVLDFWPHSLLSILKFKNKLIVGFLTKMSYWHYRRADGIIGVYKGIQTRLIDLVGIDKEKTIYIPQAAEKIYEQEIKDPSLAKRLGKGFKIVFAGNINPAQSFETVVEAARQVKEAGYKDIKYIIIGEGMSKKWLMEEVKKQGLADNFLFEGFRPVEEVPKYQTEADAMIVALSRSPLFEYGIPAKIQSYIASGTPVIAAMDGEGQQLVNDWAKCGMCADSGDADGLAKIIMKMYNMKPQERKEMGQNGRKYHFKHYERDYNLNRLIEFIFNDKRIIDQEYPELNKQNI